MYQRGTVCARVRVHVHVRVRLFMRVSVCALVCAFLQNLSFSISVLVCATGLC